MQDSDYKIRNTNLVDLVKKYDHLVKIGIKDNELEINLDVVRSDINSYDRTEEVGSNDHLKLID